MMSIVTTGAETGYYVDVFRSRKEKGGDKMHDYFYHNLGPVSYTHLVFTTMPSVQRVAQAGARLRRPITSTTQIRQEAGLFFIQVPFRSI